MSDMGWIRLSRSIQDHWLNKEKRSYSKFEAWIDILLSANHMDNKFMLGNDVVTIVRGSFVTSELKLMNKWGWSKSKLRAFLALLQKEEMIKILPDSKKTTITVVKYDDYQSSKTKEKPTKNHGKTTLKPLSDTNNNDNNDNNENKITPISPEVGSSNFNFKKSLIELGVDPSVADQWIRVRRKKGAVDTEIAFKAVDTEITKSKRTANECITIAVERSWQGFKAEWLKDLHIESEPTDSKENWKSIITAPIGSTDRKHQIVEAFKNVPQEQIPHEFREVFNAYSQIL